MGSACCVAARDRTISNESGGENLHRHVQYSPSWSFRWDNRGRVAGEETSVHWPSDGVGGNDGLETKSGTIAETADASEEGSPLDSFRTFAWHKSPVSEGNSGNLRPLTSDQQVSRNCSTMVKESRESPALSDPSPMQVSPSAHSVSSFSASPLSSQSHLLPATSTPLRWPRRSPGHQLLRQVSDSRIPGLKSPSFSIAEESSSFVLPGWSNDSNKESRGGSSDGGWSIPAFSELMGTSSQRERWSFDSESFGLSRDKISRCSSQFSTSPIDMRSCGVCSKLLTEKSLWGSQKIIATGELAVVAVLICGHVYHSECLENMTSEINKYDPACPLCTFGEKQAIKMSEKLMRAGMDLKIRNSKKSRNRVVDGDLDSSLIVFDQHKNSGHGGKGLKMMKSNSSTKSSGRPFLRRHFSFGSKFSTAASDTTQSNRKRGFFWSKSSKQ